jgi:hypothetical protein
MTTMTTHQAQARQGRRHVPVLGPLRQTAPVAAMQVGVIVACTQLQHLGINGHRGLPFVTAQFVLNVLESVCKQPVHMGPGGDLHGPCLGRVV